MSLVNDMLRDLDKRKSAYPQQTKATEGVRVTPVANSPDKVFARRWLWLVIAVGVLFLAAFAWHLYGELEPKVLKGSDFKTISHGEETELSASITAIPETAPEPSQVAPTFVEILGVEVQAVEAGARIEISLSAPVQHRVFRNGQQLIVDLPATRLAEALPNLTRHSLIRAVDVTTHAAGMQLAVDVSQPVLLQTSLVSKQQTRLIVELTTIEPDQLSSQEEPPKASQNSATEIVQLSPKTTKTAQSDDNSTVISFEKTNRQLTLEERDRQANRRALQRMRNGRSLVAERDLFSLLDEYPMAMRSRATLVALKLSQGQLGKAQQLLEDGLELAPLHRPFIKLKARLLLAKALPGEAVSLLEAHETDASEDQEFLALLASSSQRANQHQRAVDLYQQLLAQNSQQAQWWVGLAISLEALAQPQAALKAYLQARGLPGISSALQSYAEGRINQLQ